MTERLFTIPPNRLRPASVSASLESAGPALEGLAPEPPLQGIWRDKAGKPVGKRVALEPPARVMLEHPDGEGGFGGTAIERPAAFVARPPKSAHSLTIATALESLAEIPLDALQSHKPKAPAPRIETVGPATMRFVFPVIAERFDSWDAFHARGQELRDWIVAQPPFNEPGIGDRFGLKLYFWPSDPARGMFEAGDDKAPKDGQLFFGNQVLAKRLIDPWLADPKKPSLILINSIKRGGAGGSEGYSAWASTASTPGEDWQAVGLHEIGHAFGLGDEYVQESRIGEEPKKLEPNISGKARAGEAPWSAKINVDANLAPSNDLDHQFAAPGVIGTFQGARYRTDRYRPTANCLMRSTVSGTKFCKICRDHIRLTI